MCTVIVVKTVLVTFFIEFILYHVHRMRKVNAGFDALQKNGEEKRTFLFC